MKTLHEKQVTQVILSASEQGNLLSQVTHFGVEHYFDELLGLSNVYAKSKINIGREYISLHNAQDSLLVGDTQHDFEVAAALGIDCVLVARGHQSKLKLLSCNIPILSDVTQVLDYVG